MPVGFSDQIIISVKAFLALSHNIAENYENDNKHQLSTHTNDNCKQNKPFWAYLIKVIPETCTKFDIYVFIM
jgi:hypothetical protein